MRFILLLIGLGLSADGLYCGATGSMGVGEAAIVAAGVVFILWGTFYEAFREKLLLRILKGIFVGLMTVYVVYSCAICVFGIMDNDTGREDYVIVLGSSLTDNAPSKTLERRLDRAVDYLNHNNTAAVVVSGGRDRGAVITEAQAMSNYLISRGIGEGRILLEESAASTYENFYNSRDAVSDGDVVFITSNYHVPRAMLMADMCGMETTHIGAPTPLEYLPCQCARELIAQIAALRYYIE